ncbi:hypothetical protein [Candidatus Parabeggiatoa sp. HSG14]|uniref:hypothetical protein n=1 Tax=Candidatus Parabeggiatoa sp. HSG14 TaxID=3055593 RepID=UPI0025A89DA7|nr:hypothetical protein [Thiotrichales bacterium HSG14]
MSKKYHGLFALLIMGLLSPPTLSANAPPDSGSKEALKESAIRDTDTFTGKEFMVFESVKNEGYEQQEQFSKMTFYVAPLFRLIPDPETQAVYQKTPYANRNVVQYTFFVECFHPRIDEQALKKVNKYYSTKSQYVFTEEQIHHMRHGKVVIETGNLPPWITVKPVTIGTKSLNSTVMLDAVEEFTVNVPLGMDEDFQTRLNSGMKFKFVVYFNVMNISRLQLAWSIEDIRKTNAYKQINSGGAHYVTAEQVHNITRQVAEKRNVYYYQDPNIDSKIADKALKLFDSMRGEVQALSAKNRQQAAELEEKLRQGTGLSASEFKPLTQTWDVYEKLETIDNHETANKVIKNAYQRNKQAYQKLDDVYQRRKNAASDSSHQYNRDKSSSNQLNITAGFDYDVGWTKGEGNMYYNQSSQNAESLRESRADSSRSQSNDKATRRTDSANTAEDKINKGYFENADALKAYQAKTTEQKRPKVKIVGRGLNVIEKAQFEQNVSTMASFVSVQPMTEAKSFMTDSKISTRSKNDVPSMLETLKKAALLTDAVSVSKDGNVGIGQTLPAAKLDVNGDVLMTNNPANRLKVTDFDDNVKIEFVKASNGRKAGAIHFDGWSTQNGYYQSRLSLSSRTNNGESYIWDMILTEQGNVGIGTTNPKAKLDVNGNFIRTIAHATGNGPNDGTDVGQIKSRVLTFSKAKANTKIRIGYTDNLRTYRSGKGCRWEVRIDGSSCPNQALVYDDHASAKDNTHSSRTVVGYCSGIAAGSHTIGIWVSNVPGYSGSDCHTGWKSSTWVIEAEEVN